MKRQEELNEAWCSYMGKFSTELMQALAFALRWCDEHPNWISVEDELPTRNMIDEYHESDLSPEVLVCTDKGAVIMTYYDHMFKEWCCNLGTSFTHNVTHWMPLPKMPKKGGLE